MTFQKCINAHFAQITGQVKLNLHNELFFSPSFGERLKSERKRLGVSQDKMAEMLDVSRNVVGSYESEKTSPTIGSLYNAAKFGLDPGYVVTGQRADGIVHPLERSFLNDFRRLDDANKEDLMFLTAAMLKSQGKDYGDEAKIVSRIVAALVDYQSQSVTEWVADLKKNRQSQSQTVHSPAVEFRSKPKEE